MTYTDDGFTLMIDEGNTFFAELAANNTKDFFEPRKAFYNDRIKKPAALFAELAAEEFSRVAGRSYKPKVFRIYRDVRFSKDKTPYNPYLHILWSSEGAEGLSPVIFFGSEPGSLVMGSGIMGMKGEAMICYRAFIDTHGDEVSQVIGTSGLDLTNWGPEPLKRVPPPFDKDHPHGDLLKRKSLIISGDLGDAWRQSGKGLLGAVIDRFRTMQPFDALVRERI